MVVPTSLKTSVDSLGVMNVAHMSRIPNNEQILQEPSKLRFWGEGCMANGPLAQLFGDIRIIRQITTDQL